MGCEAVPMGAEGEPCPEALRGCTQAEVLGRAGLKGSIGTEKGQPPCPGGLLGPPLWASSIGLPK